MVRERIKEVVDFVRAESPYRAANKGWVNDDVYFQLGSSLDKSSNNGDELADVSIYWKPINEILSILLVVVLLATIFVLSAFSFAHGRFQIPQTNFSVTTQVAPVEVQNDEIESDGKNMSSDKLTVNSDLVERMNKLEDEANSSISSAFDGDQNLKNGLTTVDLFQPKHN